MRWSAPFGVETVTKRRKRHAQFGHNLFGRGVIMGGSESRIRARAHVTGVEHAPRSGSARRFDCRAVKRKCHFAHLIDRNDQHPLGARERLRQPGGVGEIARANVNAAFGKIRRLCGVTDAGSDYIRRHAGEQVLYDRTTEMASGSGDERGFFRRFHLSKCS